MATIAKWYSGVYSSALFCCINHHKHQKGGGMVKWSSVDAILQWRRMQARYERVYNMLRFVCDNRACFSQTLVDKFVELMEKRYDEQKKFMSANCVITR